MKKLALTLIVVGFVTGPLLTVISMWVVSQEVESGRGAAAIQAGVNLAMTVSYAGLAVAAVGLVLLVVSLYRDWNAAARPIAARP